jgi:hypothetical protein
MHRRPGWDPAQPPNLSDPIRRGLLLVIDLCEDLLEVEPHPANRAVMLDLRNRAAWLLADTEEEPERS